MNEQSLAIVLELGRRESQKKLMPADTSESRPITRWLFTPVEWSVAEKCALVLGIYLVFALWALAAGAFFLLHPERVTYLNHGALATEVRVLVVQSALTVALLAWALAARRQPHKEHKPLLYATAIACAAQVVHGAYVYGTQTRHYTAATVCGSVAVAAVLFERSLVRVWATTVLAALTLLTIGEVSGAIYYAPLLARMPINREQLEPSWMLGAGGISLAALYVAIGMTYAIVYSWHERGAKLVEAARQLAVADQVAAVINAIDDAIVVLDAQRRVVSANDAFLQRTRTTRAAIAGRSCGKLLSGLDSPAECPTRRCLQDGSRCTEVFGRPGPDGETVWEEVRSSPVFGDSGTVEQVVEVWRDISARRQAEARMADAHRLASLGMLASGFSHELNTPLATVLGCVESILRVTGAGADITSQEWKRIEKNAGIAREQLLRCRRITQHFLHLARDHGAECEIVDVDAALDEAVRLAAPTAAAAGVRLRIERPTGGTRVRGNTADLEHIILNLVLNAIQASPSGGTVRLAGEDAGPVRLQVRDEGPGIPAKDRARIFEPFCSLRPGGTGLGLFLALNFARRWGADITVESAPGTGAVFSVVWPALAGTAAIRQSA